MNEHELSLLFVRQRDDQLQAACCLCGHPASSKLFPWSAHLNHWQFSAINCYFFCDEPHKMSSIKQWSLSFKLLKELLRLSCLERQSHIELLSQELCDPRLCQWQTLRSQHYAYKQLRGISGGEGCSSSFCSSYYQLPSIVYWASST